MIRHFTLTDKFKSAVNDVQQFTGMINQFKIQKLHKENVDFTDPEDRQTIIYLLQNTKEKSKLELEFLRKAFRKLRFFEEKAQQLNETAQLMIYQCLNHQFVAKQSVLFHYGEDGETYYVVLRGSVAVLLPNARYKSNMRKGKVTVPTAIAEFDRLRYKFNAEYNTWDMRRQRKKQPSLSVKQEYDLQIKVAAGLFATRKFIVEEDAEEPSPTKKKISVDYQEGKSSGMIQQVQKESLQAFKAVDYKDFVNENRRSIRKSDKVEASESDESNNDEMEAFQQFTFPDFQCVNVMVDGESFGEIALISNQKRTATILVREDTDFATITRTNFQRILKVFHDTLKKEKANHLAKFKALKCLPNETLDALVRLIQIKSYHIHEVIYREQQDADYVYFINTGDVELSTSFSSEDMQGNAFTTIIGYSSELMTLLGQKFNSVQIKKAGVGARVRVSVVTSKQVFGWEEIMGQSCRVYQAQAIAPTEVYILPRQQFIELLSESEDFLRYFTKRDKLLSELRTQAIGNSVREMQKIHLKQDKQWALMIKEQEISADMVAPEPMPSTKTKIFTQAFQAQFSSISHIKGMNAYQSKLVNRKTNLKKLKGQSHQKSLKNEPMFPIEAQKVLDKRLKEIHYKFSIIRGELNEALKKKDYLYDQPGEEKSSPQIPQSRSAAALQNILSIQRTKLPSIHLTSEQLQNSKSLSPNKGTNTTIDVTSNRNIKKNTSLDVATRKFKVMMQVMSHKS